MSYRSYLIAWGACLALVVTLVITPTSLAQPIGQSGAEDIIHWVRRGETLATIAARYHTTVARLAAYNGLSNPNFVYVGQRLRVPIAQTSSAEATNNTQVHIVRPGEYLALIANRYGTTVGALMRENGLSDGNFLYVGQRLRIPGAATTRVRVAPTPQPAQPAESPPSAATPPVTPAPPTSSTVHVVKRGEFLASIAHQHGVSVQTILAANRLANPNILYVGQRLNIPSSGLAAAPRPAPAVSSPQRSASKAANIPTAGKWIDVNVRTQTLSAYEGDQLIFTTKVSTGLPRTPTVLGRFAIRTKLRAQTMVGPGYYLPNVPYVMYFYRGYAIHGTYWHNNFGRPMSRGCINMRTSEAQWLYQWASIGTPVITHR